MALDSAAKRFSIQNVGCPWRPLTVVPSGSVTQAERQQFIYQYGGILWDAPSVPDVAPPDDDADTARSTYTDRDGATILVPRLTAMHAMDSLRNASLAGPDRIPLDAYTVKSDRYGRGTLEGDTARLFAYAHRAGEAFAPRSLTLEFDPVPAVSRIVEDATSGTDADGATLSVGTLSLHTAADSLRDADLLLSPTTDQDSYSSRFFAGPALSIGDSARIRLQTDSRAGSVSCPAFVELEFDLTGPESVSGAT